MGKEPSPPPASGRFASLVLRRRRRVGRARPRPDGRRGGPDVGDLRRGDVSPGRGTMVEDRGAGLDHPDGFSPDVLESPAGPHALARRSAGIRGMGGRSDRPSREVAPDHPDRRPLDLARGTPGHGELGQAAPRPPGHGDGLDPLRPQPEPARPRLADHDGTALARVHHGDIPRLLVIPQTSEEDRLLGGRRLRRPGDVLQVHDHPHPPDPRPRMGDRPLARPRRRLGARGAAGAVP